ncbi:MAG: FxLYD domain-containing protein [Bryobacteraceae bacterium]
MRGTWLLLAFLCAGCSPARRDVVGCVEVRSELTRQGPHALRVEGELYNGCKVKLATVSAKFGILDRGGAQIESIDAVTEDLNPGRSWKFKIAPTREISDEQGPVHLKVVKISFTAPH